MKTLITAIEVRKRAELKEKTIFVDEASIVTPAARDVAKELGVAIEYGKGCTAVKATAPAINEASSQQPVSEVDPTLIARITEEVIRAITGYQRPQDLIKEADASGLRLIRGNSVELEEFNTGNPKDKVKIKEILNNRESPNMATGFMELQDTTFSWDLKYEELDYIIEGTLDMIIDGKTYRGKAGDVFYLPKDTRVTFSTPDKVKFFFVTYPANWAELSGYQKD
ncbi:MAG: cupin domain-containing protein [Bacillota bacterium]|nr:cupin domain-containing protein [Bacillota bacterium]